MAGKRQHFLPKLLLRGFVSRRHKRSAFVWQFRKGHEPTEPNIINVGVASQFYGSSKDPLDDLFTRRENSWAHLLHKVRRAQGVTPDDVLELVECVSMLLFRTNHIRKGLETILRRVTEGVIAHEGTPSSIERTTEACFDEKVEEIIGSLRGTSGFDEDDARRTIAKDKTRLIAEVTREAIPVISWALAELMDRIPGIGRDAHNTALLRTVERETTPLREALGRLNWSVLSVTNRSLILGDLVAVLHDPDADTWVPASTMTFGTALLLLPISDQHLLVGTSRDGRPEFSIEALNRAMASMSREFFVSSRNTENERAYAELIGTQSELVSDEEIRNLLAEKRRDPEQPPEPKS